MDEKNPSGMFKHYGRAPQVLCKEFIPESTHHEAPCLNPGNERGIIFRAADPRDVTRAHGLLDSFDGDAYFGQPATGIMGRLVDSKRHDRLLLPIFGLLAGGKTEVNALCPSIVFVRPFLQSLAAAWRSPLPPAPCHPCGPAPRRRGPYPRSGGSGYPR